MELKIKVSVNTTEELKKFMQTVKEMEKEYNCHCTLLDVTITHPCL